MSNDGQGRKLGYLYESLFNLGLLKVLKEKKNYFPYWLKSFESFPIREYALKIFEGSRRTELLTQNPEALRNNIKPLKGSRDIY